jgi:hypothetical protein
LTYTYLSVEPAASIIRAVMRVVIISYTLLCELESHILSFSFQPKYIQRLKAIKATLEASDLFTTHEVSCHKRGMDKLQVLKFGG